MSRPWTKQEEARLRRLYAKHPNTVIAKRMNRTEPAILQRAMRLGLRKPEALKKASCFQKGFEPWNKGLKGWQAGGRSERTQFKRREPPHNTVAVGTIVTDADGYLKRKVRDDIRPGESRRNWVYLHVEKWERYRGPVPKGHAVVFKNGDKADVRIANLECISRQELMRRNSVHRLPKELAQAVQLLGALNRQINTREGR